MEWGAISAAAVAAGAGRLVQSWQFDVGVVLMSMGLAMRLYRNVTRIVALAFVLIVGAYFVGRSATVRPWAVTAAMWLVVPLGEFLGMWGVVGMLVRTDLVDSGLKYAVVFSFVYLATLQTPLSKRWLKPSKIRFIFQSFCLFGGLIVRSEGLDKYLPSVLAGWGSVFLGMVPQGTVISAFKFAAVSALAVGGASSAKGATVAEIKGYWGWFSNSVRRTWAFARTLKIEDFKPSELKQNIECKLGCPISSFSPPKRIALAIAFFRILVSVIVALLSIGLMVGILVNGDYRSGMLCVPVLLCPFVFAEAIECKLFLASPSYQSEDGLTILLWKSPESLILWKSLNQADAADVPRNTFDGIVEMFLSSPGGQVPRFTYMVVLKLVLSIIIDIIGVSSYAIPGLGEFTDFGWAPLQGYLIQRMYGIPFLSCVGVVEEILPFTDWIPTATIAFFITYGRFIPTWARNRGKND